RALLSRLANEEGVAKVSTRDVAPLIAGGGLGATTVAATVEIAAQAAISVMPTGGIGGVHRGAERSLDESADLLAIARHPVCVVCAGAKLVLDLALTLERLETLGVPVIGFGTDDFPASYVRGSGLRAPHRAATALAAARIVREQLARGAGIVVAVPIAQADAIDRREADAEVDRAIAAAEREGVRGTAHAFALGGGDRTVDLGVRLAPIDRVSLRDGDRDDDAGPACELLADDARRGERRGRAMRRAQSAPAYVGRGEVVGPEADHRDTERLETLERQREVEDELRPGAHHADRMARDGEEVGRFVERPLRATVHAADAAGRHHADAGLRRDLHGRGHCRRAEPAARDHWRDVARAHLRDSLLVREAGEERAVGADDGAARRDRDGRRCRAARAHLVLERDRRLEIQRPRETVRDDGRFERDDGAFRGDRRCDRGIDL